MPPFSKAATEKYLIRLTNRVGRMLGTRVRQELSEEEQDFQSAHFAILSDLWLADGVRQQDLAAALVKDKGTIARALRQMEQKRLIERRPDARDKRTKRIYLTAHGNAFRDRLLPIAERVMHEATREVDPYEYQICLKVLGQIHGRLTHILQQPQSKSHG